MSGLGKAIRDHLRDFLAIIALLVAGLATTGYILSQQQQPYPGWVPFIGDDTIELRAELSSAQAVMPGQGQTVNISGVEVGDVTDVSVENGEAVVTMLVNEEYAPIVHTDATVLMRPRTGLQDQTMELDPGTEAAPQVEDGFTIPSAQTDPNVNPDQILASLDGDTQAYLRLLVEGGGRGLGGNGEELSATLRRLEPLSRDLARINGRLIERRRNIARSISNFRKVSEELGARDTQLAEFVANSNAALEGFANQEASIRETLRELPSTLTATRAALDSGERFAAELGPASTALLPSARLLKPALEETQPFLERTVAPIRDQIRPFTREVRRPIRALSDASGPLGDATRRLTGAFGELNRLFNGLAFNPPGAEEGYLFWAAWLNHNQNGLFAFQDAHGPIRRGIVLQSCQTALAAEGVATGTPRLQTLQEVTRVVKSADVCPLDPP